MEDNMKIAVTHDNGMVFQHFGKTAEFKFYTVEGKDIKESSVIGTEGKGHGELVDFLKSHHADLLICGGLGGGAKSALSDAGIKVFGGTSGNTDELVKAYLEGKLEYNPDVQCNHHHHEGEGEEGHSCHGKCGSDKSSDTVIKLSI